MSSPVRSRRAVRVNRSAYLIPSCGRVECAEAPRRRAREASLLSGRRINARRLDSEHSEQNHRAKVRKNGKRGGLNASARNATSHNVYAARTGFCASTRRGSVSVRFPPPPPLFASPPFHHGPLPGPTARGRRACRAVAGPSASFPDRAGPRRRRTPAGRWHG